MVRFGTSLKFNSYSIYSGVFCIIRKLEVESAGAIGFTEHNAHVEGSRAGAFQFGQRTNETKALSS